MAYGATYISPLDLRSSTGIGVKIPFSEENVFTTVYTTKEQTKYNLINYILTNTRERPFNPNFGLGLRNYIFEQISSTTAEDMEIMIRSKIEYNFPNIEIVNLSVYSNTDRNSINIEFSYRLKNTNDTDNVKVNIISA
jgi:phage baseplate assembly protein W